MPGLADDPELLKAFRAGRPDALERLYREHVRSVDACVRALARASGHRNFGRTESVADLIQEIFVRAFSHSARQNYDGVRDFVPYLMSIARNCFIDALRVAGREVPRSDAELLRLVEEAAPPADEWCDARTLALLDSYVCDLPDKLKGVYEQRFVLGKSQHESSAALGLTRRAIRTAEARLRRGLRKALVRAGIKLGDIPDRQVDFPARIAATAVKGSGRT